MDARTVDERFNRSVGNRWSAVHPGVTAVIPSIPSRTSMLDRAIKSVFSQTHPVSNLIVGVDHHREGAWTTRWRAAQQVTTEWTAFLDDDDEWMSHHVALLLNTASENNADMTWGWFSVNGNPDPFPHYRGRQYDPAQPHIVPITYIVRTELLLAGSGFQSDSVGSWDLQDKPVLEGIIAAGGRLHADPRDTWIWHHHGTNTSGLPTRW